MFNQFNPSDKSATSLLQQAYNNAFIETPSYNFLAPSAAKMPAVLVDSKQQHCINCGCINEVQYVKTGSSYADHEQLALQKILHEKYNLDFPHSGEIQEFTFQQEGYCTNCFPMVEKSLSNPGQLLYKLCSRLVGADAMVLSDVILLLDADKEIHDYLAAYRETSEALIAEIKALLSEITSDSFEAYVGRPMNLFDSLSLKMFNEYTVLAPIQGTPEDFFFVKGSIKKTNVLNFLQLPRIYTVEQLLNELNLTKNSTAL